MRLAIAASILAAASFSLPSLAEEPYTSFLNGLRKAGYGEAAIDYIEQIEKKPDLPVALREVMDLERAQSLLVAADETEHRDVAEQRLASAKTSLDKFLKEHAEHERAASALASMADLEIQRGRTLLRQSRVQKEAADKTRMLTEARVAFEAAQPRLTTAVDRYKARFGRLANEKQSRSKTKGLSNRDEQLLEGAEGEWLEMRGKVALLDYYKAQTYPDPADKARKECLVNAGNALDAIYQRERAKSDGLTATGIYAHMWHGKVLEELGDLIAAEDIYDEVLANAPTKDDRRAAQSPLAPLYAQVEYFRLLILIKNKEIDEFILEARAWLDGHQRSEKTNGYQGIALELAKALGAKIESSKGEDARKIKREAQVMLAKMAEIPSEFQQDAIVLRRLMGDSKEAIATYKEAIAMAQAAAESNQLNEASDYYTQAIALAAKDPSVPPEDVITSRFRLANIQWAAGKLDEAANTAEAIVADSAKSPTAPAAAVIALNASKAKYFAESKPDTKAEALKRMVKIAHDTIQNWPDRAEADDARIAVGQAHMVRGELDEALKAFETVKPESTRYSQSLQQAGQVNWQLYLQEKAKPPAQRDATRLTALRDKAEKQLIQTREAQRKALPAGEPLPQTLIDTELLLAEVSLEGNRAEEAAKLLEPLLEVNKASGSLDRTRLRMYLAAVRAYVAIKDFDKAANVANVLFENGDDSPVVNLVLVDFVRMLGAENKRIQALAIAADAGTDAAAKEATKASAKNVQALFTKVVEKLTARRFHSIPNMIYLSETAAELGLTQQAREQFTTILKKADDEKGSVQPQAAIRIRAKLIGLLRNEKKLAEALPEVDKLITATGGKALEPLIEKGQIIQSIAESAPYNAKLYDATIGYWTNLRLRMQNMNPKPPEYYQLIYNTANCLLVQAEQAKDPGKAKQAIQILNSVLQLNRSLLAPDMVTKYDALVAKARQFQGQPAVAPTKS